MTERVTVQSPERIVVRISEAVAGTGGGLKPGSVTADKLARKSVTYSRLDDSALPGVDEPMRGDIALGPLSETTAPPASSSTFQRAEVRTPQGAVPAIVVALSPSDPERSRLLTEDHLWVGADLDSQDGVDTWRRGAIEAEAVDADGNPSSTLMRIRLERAADPLDQIDLPAAASELRVTICWDDLQISRGAIPDWAVGDVRIPRSALDSSLAAAIVSGITPSGTGLTYTTLGGGSVDITISGDGDSLQFLPGAKNFSKAEAKKLNGILLVSTSGMGIGLPALDSGDTVALAAVRIAGPTAAQRWTLTQGDSTTETVDLSLGDTLYAAWSGAGWSVTRVPNGASHDHPDEAAPLIVTASRSLTQPQSLALDGREVWWTGGTDGTLSIFNPRASGAAAKDIYIPAIRNLSPTGARITITSPTASLEEQAELDEAGGVAVGIWNSTDAKWTFREIAGTGGGGSSETEALPALVHEIDNSGDKADAIHDIELDDYWEEWRGRDVFFSLKAAQAHAADIRIRPGAGGAWTPESTVHRQRIELLASWWYRGTSINFEPPRADRPEITVAALLPAARGRQPTARRFYGRLLISTTDGECVLRIAHNRAEGDSGADDDLSDAWEKRGSLILEIGGDSISIPGPGLSPGSDDQEPYAWTPPNADAVKAFAISHNTAANGTQAGVLTLVVPLSGGDGTVGERGDRVRMAKLWEDGKFLLSRMSVAHHGGDGWSTTATSEAGAAIDPDGLPWDLIYAGGFDGGSSPPWYALVSPRAAAADLAAPVIETLTADTIFRLDQKWAAWKDRRVYFAAAAGSPTVTIDPTETPSGHVSQTIALPWAWLTERHYRQGGFDAGANWEPPKGSRPKLAAGLASGGEAYLGRMRFELTRETKPGSTYFSSTLIEIVLAPSQTADIPPAGSAASAITTTIAFDATYSSSGALQFTWGTWLVGHPCDSPPASARTADGKYRYLPTGRVGLDRDWYSDGLLDVLNPHDPSGHYVPDGTDASITLSSPGSTTPRPAAWTPPAADRGARIEFAGLYDGAGMQVREMATALHAGDGAVQYREAVGNRVSPAPTGVPWMLTFDDFRGPENKKYPWGVRPLAPLPPRGIAGVVPFIVEEIGADHTITLSQIWEQWRDRTVYLAPAAGVTSAAVHIQPGSRTQTEHQTFRVPFSAYDKTLQGGDSHCSWTPAKNSRPQLDDGLGADAFHDADAGDAYIARIRIELTGPSVVLYLADSQTADIPRDGATSGGTASARLSEDWLDPTTGGYLHLQYGAYAVALPAPAAADHLGGGIYKWSPPDTTAPNVQSKGDFRAAAYNFIVAHDPDPSVQARFDLYGAAAVAGAWSPPAEDRGGEIEIIPLLQSTVVDYAYMSIAALRPDATPELIAQNPARRAVYIPSSTPHRLIWADDYQPSGVSSGSDWLMIPLVAPHIEMPPPPQPPKIARCSPTASAGSAAVGSRRWTVEPSMTSAYSTNTADPAKLIMPSAPRVPRHVGYRVRWLRGSTIWAEAILDLHPRPDGRQTNTLVWLRAPNIGLIEIDWVGAAVDIGPYLELSAQSRENFAASPGASHVDVYEVWGAYEAPA